MLVSNEKYTLYRFLSNDTERLGTLDMSDKLFLTILFLTELPESLRLERLIDNACHPAVSS